MKKDVYPIPKEYLSDDEVMIVSKESIKKMQDSQLPIEWTFINGEIIYE